jgi:hypothetical protein
MSVKLKYKFNKQAILFVFNPLPWLYGVASDSFKAIETLKLLLSYQNIFGLSLNGAKTNHQLFNFSKSCRQFIGCLKL